MSELESPLLCLVRLSLRRSRRDFSPLTAPALASWAPAELDPDVEDSGTPELVALDALAVSTLRLGWPGRFGRCRSSSTQSAGVGGTGPRAATPPGGGRRVGGEATGSDVLLRLCDLEPGGGGPGGGGGSGMPGSHRDWDAERDLADVGVSMALADAALLAAGGATGWPAMWSVLGCGTCIIRVCGLGAGAGAGCRSGGVVEPVVSLRLLREGRPNLLSRDAPLPPVFGGGGKHCWPAGSGDGRCRTVGGIRAADVFAGGVSSS